MAYLVKADLTSHIYVENIDEITRGDDTLITKAIDAALTEAKGYLSRFNRTKLFDPNATGFVTDENLKKKVKDMAAFNLIVLSNVSVNYDILKDLNDLAIRWFDKVQAGKADPEGWPYKDDDEDTDFPEGTAANLVCNTKRNNSY